MKLIIEPADGVRPLLTVINSAKKSVEIAVFRFDRKDIESALKAAATSGVAVTALIAFANRGGERNPSDEEGQDDRVVASFSFSVGHRRVQHRLDVRKRGTRRLPAALGLHAGYFEIPSHHPQHAPEFRDAAQAGEMSVDTGR